MVLAESTYKDSVATNKNRLQPMDKLSANSMLLPNT